MLEDFASTADERQSCYTAMRWQSLRFGHFPLRLAMEPLELLPPVGGSHLPK